MKICFWCVKSVTSMEHVLPKSIFPEEKDVKNIFSKSFRTNLITVHSCEEHNLNKSNLDEYLMVHLSSKVGNNNVAYIHTLTKVNRSITRNPKLFDIDKEDIIEINDKKYPVLWINIDTKKLLYSFEAVARALFFMNMKMYLRESVSLCLKYSTILVILMDRD